MAILTWRNVDAPNFSGALEGYRAAGQLLNNAVKSGQDAVGAYTQANTDAADRAIMNRALGLQTAEQHQAALASGALVGSDGQNASMKVLGDLDARSGTLLNRDVVRENLDQTQYDNQRVRTGNTLSDATGPDGALARMLARNNDQVSLNKLLSTSTSIQNLRPDQQAAFLTSLDNLSTSSQGRRNSDSTFVQGQWRFGNEVRDSDDAQVAQAAWLQIQEDNATPKDIEGAINRRSGSMSPGAHARLVNAAKGAGVTVNGLIGSGVSGGVGVAPSGSGGSPASGTLISRFVDGLAKLETDGGPRTVKGPAGQDSFNLFNIKDFSKTGSGFRAKDAAEGSNDRYRVYANTDEAKADLMKLLSTRYPAALQAKNGAEFAKALKDGGYATDPDYIKKLTRVIGDTSDVADGDPAAALKNEVMGRAGNNLGTDIARQAIQERAGQNQISSIFPELNALQSDRRPSIEIVDTLVGEGKTFPEGNRADMVDIIDGIVERSGDRISPAMVGAMISRNVDRSDGGYLRALTSPAGKTIAGNLATIGSPISRAGMMIADVVGAPFGRLQSTPDIGGGLRIDDRGLNRMVDQYLGGETTTQLIAQQGLLAEDQALEGLRTQYNAADALYREMRTQSESRPGLARNLKSYEQKRDTAAEALRRAIESASKRKSLQPRHDRPDAPSRTGSW